MTGSHQIALTALFFKEQLTSYSMYDIQTETGSGDISIRILIELSNINLQGIEDTNFDILFVYLPQHSVDVGGCETEH